MARKPSAGVCVHCLEHVEERNWDHVLPRGWYPDSTPDNVEKWKIPTCKRCNSAYGKLEERLGIILSACVDPTGAAASGIWEKFLRSLDPSQATSESDRKARECTRAWLQQQVRPRNELPCGGEYPGLGERWGRVESAQPAISIPARDLEALVQKVVKGIAYIEDGQLINADREIEHLVVDSKGQQRIEQLLERFGETKARGPGITVTRAVTPEDGVSAFYKVVIWGEVIMYASVTRREAPEG